jgi:hypothetical protein
MKLPNKTLAQTAGSHTLAAAAHRERWANLHETLS